MLHDIHVLHFILDLWDLQISGRIYQTKLFQRKYESTGAEENPASADN
jgi:hypothetical protein